MDLYAPYPKPWRGEVVDLTAGRYDDPSMVYGGHYANANPWYDEVDQGYRERGENENEEDL